MSALEVPPHSPADTILEAIGRLSHEDSQTVLLRLLLAEVQQKSPYLSEKETELLAIIQKHMTPEFKREYKYLQRRLRAETLTPAEHSRFIELSNELEGQNALRYAALIALAQVRNKSLDEIKADLKIKPLINE